MKRFSSLIVSTALFLSAFGFTGAATATKAVSPSPSLLRRGAAAVRFAPRQIKEANRKLRYTITVKYPQAVGSDPRFERLNHALRSLTTEQIAGFKKDFEAPDERMGPMGSTFDVSYTVKLATPDLVSIIFYIDSFYEGAAHPNHNTVTFNYSFATEKTMTLAELFRGNNYLKVISNYAIRDLKKQLGPEPDSEWIQKGAGPEEENYKAWNVTRRGLLITFDQYQVASYAEGPHEVMIPYSVLKSVIDPEGPLSKVAGVAARGPRTGALSVPTVENPERGKSNKIPVRQTVSEDVGVGYGEGWGGIGPGKGARTAASEENGIGSGPGQGNSEQFDPNKIFSAKEVDVKARLLSRPEPQMTEEAKRNNVNGTVILRVVLSALGHVTEVMVIKSLPYGLSERAVSAAQQIRFSPAMKNGRPVSQYILIEYNFNSY